MFGFSFGVSSIAEIQLDGGLRDSLSIKRPVPAPLSGMLTVTGTHTADFPDATDRREGAIPVRDRVTAGDGRAVLDAVAERGQRERTRPRHHRFQLQHQSRQDGAVGSHRRQFRVRHPSPIRCGATVQNDVFNYGFSVARAVQPGVEVVGELNGRQNTRSGTPPVGTESRSMMRLGARFTRGPVRIDGALLIGVTEHDPTWGFTTGLTWVFKAFTIQP